MKIFKSILNGFLKIIYGVGESAGTNLGQVKSILVVRQHNQLGDVIASTPMFGALKEKYPQAAITVIVSPQNYKAIEKNPFISTMFVYDRHKLSSLTYLKSLRNILKKKYDITVVPVCTSISFTSDFIARLSNSNIRIGARSLDGCINPYSFFFNKLIDLDWRDKPDTHSAIRNLSILTPFGIATENLSPTIYSDDTDAAAIKEFMNSIPGKDNTPIIGLHIGAGKIQNRWHHMKFAELIDLLALKYDARFYLTCGGEGDKELIDAILKNNNNNIKVFTLPGMSLLKSLLDQSSLFITNDTGPMHVAAASKIPVISLFGPTNPNMWAPVGENKVFIKKEEDIDSISVEEVFAAAQKYLKS
jgi:ADP-heptose:LPS heptosyltransferase